VCTLGLLCERHLFFGRLAFGAARFFNDLIKVIYESIVKAARFTQLQQRFVERLQY